ncbi:hypothetical protein AGMMS49965_23390 [Bacteroidia bacterium]|nr:hypothetical protein AGMMS49965_23390 [Bacteroidia bacterium]
MRKIFVSLFALASLSVAYGQKTVVVLDPIVSGDQVTDMQKAIIRAALEEFISVNVGEVVTHANADLKCATQITAEGEDFLVKSSLVEMNSGRTVFTVSELMKTTPKSELQDGCKRLGKKLIDAAGKASLASPIAKSTNATADAKSTATTGATIYKPDGIELVYVEGSQRLAGFYIGKYEVTQAQWMEVMGNNPSRFQGTNYPVENVSWNDAQAFIAKLNEKSDKEYRLPTEAEWLFAAGEGNRNSSFNYSGSNTVKEVAWCADNADGSTHPVGKKKANGLGIHDMSGNVWEWCADKYDDKSRASRGGGYSDYPSRCSLTVRSGNGPSFRFGDLGFRVVLSPQ